MCGQEATKRSRSFKWIDNGKQCEEKFGKVLLEEKMDCGNSPCPDDYPVSKRWLTVQIYLYMCDYSLDVFFCSFVPLVGITVGWNGLLVQLPRVPELNYVIEL